MKIKKIFAVTVVALILCAIASGCDDGKSYAEMLDTENHSVNRFLADQIVEAKIPVDSVFEVGPDAPYYQIDDEGAIFMQVINVGNLPKPEKGQLVYFRFRRAQLNEYQSGKDLVWSGNADDLTMGNTSFRYDDFSLASTAKWGTAIQRPLAFLGLNSEVNLVIKSQYGPTDEIASVQPFLYNIKYYQSQI